MASIETSRISERSSGKIPTTSVRRPISLLKRSSGLVLLSSISARREAVEGEEVVLGVGQQRRHLRQDALQLRQCFAQPGPRLLQRGGAEDRPDQRRQQAVLVLARVAEAVPEEGHGAALPG